MAELYYRDWIAISECSSFYYKINGETYNLGLTKINKPIPNDFNYAVTFTPDQDLESELVFIETDNGWFIVSRVDDTMIIKFWSSPEVLQSSIKGWFPIIVPDLTKEPKVYDSGESYLKERKSKCFGHTLRRELERMAWPNSKIPIDKFKINLIG